MFKHYEIFTNVSGLELNADKTEILPNNINGKTLIKYLDKEHIINNAAKAKINGITFDINCKNQYHNNWESGIKNERSTHPMASSVNNHSRQNTTL